MSPTDDSQVQFEDAHHQRQDGPVVTVCTPASMMGSAIGQQSRSTRLPLVTFLSLACVAMVIYDMVLLIVNI